MMLRVCFCAPMMFNMPLFFYFLFFIFYFNVFDIHSPPHCGLFQLDTRFCVHLTALLF
jgi:hypothetical protein